MLEFAQGGIAHLVVEYKDGTGALTDPTTPLIDILNPSNSVVVNDATPVRDSLGSYHYDFSVPVDAPLGEWTARWSGTISGSPLTANDIFEVVPVGSIVVVSNDLLTLAEYKALMGLQAGDVRKDPQVEALLPAASRAVRSYTGRAFELAAGPATEREYQYDDSGVLDIDDCQSIDSLSTDAGVIGQSYPITAEQWTAMPQDDSEVYYYLIVHGGPYFGASPEMGFKRNLDQYPYMLSQPLVRVTAQWGWDEIPADVKLAAALTISEFLGSASSAGQSEGLTAEGIEGWNRSWGSRSGGVTALAIPNRARDLLVNYQRIYV